MGQGCRGRDTQLGDSLALICSPARGGFSCPVNFQGFGIEVPSLETGVRVRIGRALATGWGRGQDTGCHSVLGHTACLPGHLHCTSGGETSLLQIPGRGDSQVALPAPESHERLGGGDLNRRVLCV